MAHETEKTVGEYTSELPFSEVPVFAYAVDQKTHHLDKVIVNLAGQIERSTDGIVSLNISQDPKKPEELKANRHTLEALQRTLSSQEDYFNHITWEAPGDELFEVGDDQTTPPKWLRFFPTDL